MKSFSLSAIVNKKGHNAGGCLEEEEGSSWSGIAMLNGASNTSRPQIYTLNLRRKRNFSLLQSCNSPPFVILPKRTKLEIRINTANHVGSDINGIVAIRVALYAIAASMVEHIV